MSTDINTQTIEYNFLTCSLRYVTRNQKKVAERHLVYLVIFSLAGIPSFPFFKKHVVCWNLVVSWFSPRNPSLKLKLEAWEPLNEPLNVLHIPGQVGWRRVELVEKFVRDGEMDGRFIVDTEIWHQKTPKCVMKNFRRVFNSRKNVSWPDTVSIFA